MIVLCRFARAQFERHDERGVVRASRQAVLAEGGCGCVSADTAIVQGAAIIPTP
jgi:hypothetical protein